MPRFFALLALACSLLGSGLAAAELRPAIIYAVGQKFDNRVLG